MDAISNSLNLRAAVSPLITDGRSAFERFVSTKKPVKGWSVVHMDIANFGLLNKVMGRAKGDMIIAILNESLIKDHRFFWFYLGGDAWVGVSERRHNLTVEHQVSELRKELKAVISKMLGALVRFDMFFGLSFGHGGQILAYQAECACREARRVGKWLLRGDDIQESLSENGFLNRYMMGGSIVELIQLHRQAIQYCDGSRHYEVLSRYQGGSMGAELAVMERLGLAVDFDISLLRAALAAIPEGWEKHTVNLSNITVCDLGAVSQIVEMLRGRKNIAVEITETAEIHEIQLVAGVIEMLRSAGIDVYLDDFGEGATSLSMLALPWSAVKLSKTICGRSCPQDILHSVISLAKARGMTVIAECVETEQHMASLRNLGVDAFQGFFFHMAEPIPLTGLSVEGVSILA